MSSSVAATDEQMEGIPDEELSLQTNKFQRFYNNRKERRSGCSRRCFECGDLRHFIADCLKKKKKYDYTNNSRDQRKKKKNNVNKKDKTSKKLAKAVS